MSDVVTKRGPYASTKRRREEIARAVLDLVLESGHEGVTLAQVAERAGISEATMLYHFPSKDHLLVAALELSDELSSAATRVDGDGDVDFSLEDFRALVAGESPNDPLLRLLRVLTASALNPEHPAVQYLSRRTTLQIEIFTRLIASRQRAGDAHPGLDARRTAIQLLAVWDGLTTLWLADPAMDVADLLIDAYRRLAGENVMDARAVVRDRDFGL